MPLECWLFVTDVWGNKIESEESFDIIVDKNPQSCSVEYEPTRWGDDGPTVIHVVGPPDTYAWDGPNSEFDRYYGVSITIITRSKLESESESSTKYSMGASMFKTDGNNLFIENPKISAKDHTDNMYRCVAEFTDADGNVASSHTNNFSTPLCSSPEFDVTWTDYDPMVDGLTGSMRQLTFEKLDRATSEWCNLDYYRIEMMNIVDPDDDPTVDCTGSEDPTCYDWSTARKVIVRNNNIEGDEYTYLDNGTPDDDGTYAHVRWRVMSYGEGDTLGYWMSDNDKLQLQEKLRPPTNLECGYLITDDKWYGYFDQSPDGFYNAYWDHGSIYYRPISSTGEYKKINSSVSDKIDDISKRYRVEIPDVEIERGDLHEIECIVGGISFLPATVTRRRRPSTKLGDDLLTIHGEAATNTVKRASLESRKPNSCEVVATFGTEWTMDIIVRGPGKYSWDSAYSEFNSYQEDAFVTIISEDINGNTTKIQAPIKSFRHMVKLVGNTLTIPLDVNIFYPGEDMVDVITTRKITCVVEFFNGITSLATKTSVWGTPTCPELISSGHGWDINFTETNYQGSSRYIKFLKFDPKITVFCDLAYYSVEMLNTVDGTNDVRDDCSGSLDVDCEEWNSAKKKKIPSSAAGVEHVLYDDGTPMMTGKYAHVRWRIVAINKKGTNGVWNKNNDVIQLEEKLLEPSNAVCGWNPSRDTWQVTFEKGHDPFYNAKWDQGYVYYRKKGTKDAFKERFVGFGTDFVDPSKMLFREEWTEG